MFLLLRVIPKPLFFAVFGMLGCVFGAAIGEAALAVLLPNTRSASVDVLFVLDITGSMASEINGVKNGIASFVANLGRRDVRVGLVAFGDQCEGEENNVLSFPSGTFTSDTTAFSQAVGNVSLVGGGDAPETSLDALILGASQPFAPDAVKAIVLITDAPPHVRGGETENCGIVSRYQAPTYEDAIHALTAASISQLHLVVAPEYQSWFSALHTKIPGEIFPLGEGGRQNFDRLLPKIGERIAMAIGTGSVAAGQGPALVVATAVWTVCLAIGVFLFLVVAQNLYLRRRPMAFGWSTIGAVLGVAAAGLLAGAAGQWLASTIGTGEADTPARIVAWAILGGILSRGVAFFIPNLSASRALLGGAVGGALGAAGFVWATTGAGFEGRIGDAVGRLAGAAILGFLIGLMISIVERMFRECWLEVSYGPKEVRTVNLGAEPVSFGGDPANCTVYAAGTPSRAYAYRLEQGHVVCQDLATGRSDTVLPGHRLQIGKLGVLVCAAVAKPAPADQAHPSPGKIATLLALHFSSARSFPLTVGRRFTPKDIPGLEPQAADGAVAEVNQNPKDPSVFGLKNLSFKEWEARLPDGQIHRIPTGKSVRLVAGSRIKFGVAEGEVMLLDRG